MSFISELCTPAFLYFWLAMIGILITVFQNLGNTKNYNLGTLSAKVPSTLLVFIVKIMYVLLWTWVLNLICQKGYQGISWFLVFFPFILLFLVTGVMMGGKKK